MDEFPYNKDILAKRLAFTMKVVADQWSNMSTDTQQRFSKAVSSLCNIVVVDAQFSGEFHFDDLNPEELEDVILHPLFVNRASPPFGGNS